MEIPTQLHCSLLLPVFRSSWVQPGIIILIFSSLLLTGANLATLKLFQQKCANISAHFPAVQICDLWRCADSLGREEHQQARRAVSHHVLLRGGICLRPRPLSAASLPR
eukprot:EG_transcript_38805